MKVENSKLEKLSNSVQMLCTDALDKAQTGHLGSPIGASDLATSLFANHLRFSPSNPAWHNRDRFILSVGHACILQYSLLHFLGYKKFDLESIKNLRQLNYITSGHPEYEVDAGIEVTTGPLGEGISMAVGIAMSEKIVNSKFPEVVDHNTFVLLGDGCLQEGVCYEALSLACNLNLNKLIILFDNNDITIDGKATDSNNEDMRLRMEAMGFNVLEIDGHNFDEINAALEKATKDFAVNSSKPTFIISRSHIAHKVPGKQDMPAAHSGALSKDELEGFRKNLNWTLDKFDTPKETLEMWSEISKEKDNLFEEWNSKFNSYSKKDEFLSFFNTDMTPEIKKDLEDLAKKSISEKPSLATRVASGTILEVLSKHVPNLIGGSADLSPSNNTINKNSNRVSHTNPVGNYISYGIREHAMGAFMNGASCYGMLPYGGTFLTFSDFLRPTIRLAALMRKQVIFVFTHDNITVGGDGPTHQPVEHIPSLRLIPNLEVIRPCDTIEAIEAYEIALENKETPTAVLLGREAVPHIREDFSFGNNKVRNGAYFIEEKSNAVVNILSSGSELSIAHDANKILESEGVICNLISVPSLNRFADKDENYKKSLLGDRLNIVIEASRPFGWHEVLGPNTVVFGMNTFGTAGDPEDVKDYFGFTPEKLSLFVKKQIGK